VPDREGRCFQTGVHLQLRQDVLDVAPGGVATDRQSFGDPMTVLAIGKQSEDLPLPAGQLLGQERGTLGTGEPESNRASPGAADDGSAPFRNITDGPDETRDRWLLDDVPGESGPHGPPKLRGNRHLHHSDHSRAGTVRHDHPAGLDPVAIQKFQIHEDDVWMHRASG
jgi:hypothetical protein